LENKRAIAKLQGKRNARKKAAKCPAPNCKSKSLMATSSKAYPSTGPEARPDFDEFRNPKRENGPSQARGGFTRQIREKWAEKQENNPPKLAPIRLHHVWGNVKHRLKRRIHTKRKMRGNGGHVQPDGPSHHTTNGLRTNSTISFLNARGVPPQKRATFLKKGFPTCLGARPGEGFLTKNILTFVTPKLEKLATKRTFSRSKKKSGERLRLADARCQDGIKASKLKISGGNQIGSSNCPTREKGLSQPGAKGGGGPRNVGGPSRKEERTHGGGGGEGNVASLNVSEVRV